MIKKPITIHLSTGLEARPVAQLVQVASQFNSEIYVEIGRKKVNAKSIMGMMTLGLDARKAPRINARLQQFCCVISPFSGNKVPLSASFTESFVP